MTRRGGFTIVEALVALLLLLLALQAGWALAAGIARAASALAERAESLAAARAAGWIVQEELEGARAGADVSAPAGDSFALRAFRGAALVCGLVPPRGVVVRWSGLRAPDPTKDSVLQLLGTGAWVPRGLEARVAEPGACPDRSGGLEERWTLAEATPPPGSLLRVFERGSYHLSDEALRYRIGFGGRQPLTPPSLDPARSGLERGRDGRLRLSVATRGARSRRVGPAWGRTFSLGEEW